MKIYISQKTRQALLRMGYPRQTINNWVSGRSNPSRRSKEDIKKVLRRKTHRKMAA